MMEALFSTVLDADRIASRHLRVLASSLRNRSGKVARPTVPNSPSGSRPGLIEVICGELDALADRVGMSIPFIEGGSGLSQEDIRARVQDMKERLEGRGQPRPRVSTDPEVTSGKVVRPTSTPEGVIQDLIGLARRGDDRPAPSVGADAGSRDEQGSSAYRLRTVEGIRGDEEMPGIPRREPGREHRSGRGDSRGGSRSVHHARAGVTDIEHGLPDLGPVDELPRVEVDPAREEMRNGLMGIFDTMVEHKRRETIRSAAEIHPEPTSTTPGGEHNKGDAHGPSSGILDLEKLHEEEERVKRDEREEQDPVQDVGSSDEK